MSALFEFDLAALALKGLEAEAEMADIVLHRAEKYAFVSVSTGRLTAASRRSINNARDAARLADDRVAEFKRLHAPEQSDFRVKLQDVIEANP